MFGFLKRRSKPMEIRSGVSVRFLQEHDGAAERSLKDALTALFRSSETVQRAYLARVDYGDPKAFEVALCLRADENASLVAAVGKVFANIFSSDEHLDTIFLTEARERELRSVCRPFFESQSA